MYGELVPMGGGDPIPPAEDEAADWPAGDVRHRLAVCECVGRALRVAGGGRLLV
jgi:hypothetical protein